MDKQIPLVVSEGDPFARGKHLGYKESRRVLYTINAYMNIFRHFGNLNRDKVFAKAEQLIPVIKLYAPYLLEEMSGIAEGVGCDLREIVAINARTELMYEGKGRSECTSIGVSLAASADGHIRLAQNWDWYPTLTGTAVIWVLHRDDGPDLLTLTEAGIVGKIGTNATGLTMCINLLLSDSDHGNPAVPMHIILRNVLENAHSIEEAIDLINGAERSTSCHHLLADHTGSLASVEATPGGQSIVRRTDGVLTHTNHCLSAGLSVYDRGARENPETLIRGERIHSLSKEVSLDESYIRTILADHANSPNSICLHDEPDLPLEKRGESIASIIFDLTMGIVDIASGPPCCTTYRRLALSTYLR